MSDSENSLLIPFCSSKKLDWDQAKMITEFTDPWRKMYKSPMDVRLLHSQLSVHIKFTVLEPNPTVFGASSDKMGVTKSDRVEVFFSCNEKLNPYYCLEIDASGRVLDYSAIFHRQFDYSWVWPIGEMDVSTQKNSRFYQVIVKLSKYSLSQLNLLRENRLLCGFFRGKPLKEVDQIEWYSWRDPKTEEPDFHVTEALHYFQLS